MSDWTKYYHLRPVWVAGEHDWKMAISSNNNKPPAITPQILVLDNDGITRFLFTSVDTHRIKRSMSDLEIIHEIIMGTDIASFRALCREHFGEYKEIP